MHKVLLGVALVVFLEPLVAKGKETIKAGEEGGEIQWGRDPHQTTAAISEKFMSPLAFDRFMAITSNQTLVDVCVWADQARGWFPFLFYPLLPPFSSLSSLSTSLSPSFLMFPPSLCLLV